MRTFFADINDEMYIVKCLSYNIETESYKIDKKKLETWEKATFSCPPESINFAFIESVFMDPPPTKFLSMYQTI